MCCNKKKLEREQARERDTESKKKEKEKELWNQMWQRGKHLILLQCCHRFDSRAQ